MIHRLRNELMRARHPRRTVARIRTRARHSVGPGPTEIAYLLVSFCTWAARASRAVLGRRLGRVSRRTPAMVGASYDAVRGRLAITTFDEYVFGSPDERAMVLADGHVRWGSRTDVRRAEREHVVEVVAAACAGIADPVVVEMGSGNGANLLLLERQHPRIRAIGLELSPVSVDLARRAAEAFGLDVVFHAADVTMPIAIDLGTRVDVAFSCHALEQMPDVFRGAVDNLLGLAASEVIFFEPVRECYPRNLRGAVGRLRMSAVHYLNGLHDDLVRRGADITSVRTLGFGLTPFNETVEIHVRTATATRPAPGSALAGAEPVGLDAPTSN